MKFLLVFTYVLVLSVSSVTACGSLETELGSFGYQPIFSFLQKDNLAAKDEKHLKNVRQLSFGGENAEAYFSSDAKHLIFQSKRDGRGCDQMYTMNADGSNVRMVSSGESRNKSK